MIRIAAWAGTAAICLAFGMDAGNGEFGNLHGLIVDKTTGFVYVADTANNRVQVFRPIGPIKVTSS